jgi:4-hydroxyphenylacetaldehyde oxime monooxygenase
LGFQIDKLVEKLTAVGPNPIRFEEHIFATMDRIVGLFVFGESYAGEVFKGEFVPLLNETMDMLSSFSAEDFFPNAAGRLIDRLTGVKARREAVFHKLDGFYEHIIDQNDKRKAAGGSDLVQELVDLMKTNASFTRDNVKSILMVKNKITPSITATY